MLPCGSPWKSEGFSVFRRSEGRKEGWVKAFGTVGLPGKFGKADEEPSNQPIQEMSLLAVPATTEEPRERLVSMGTR